VLLGELQAFKLIRWGGGGSQGLREGYLELPAAILALVKARFLELVTSPRERNQRGPVTGDGVIT
jgi:hypothetical protein